jgi:hypothetical protein
MGLRNLPIALAAPPADKVRRQLFTLPADPAHPACRISNHQRKRWYIFRHHGARADETVFSELVSADYGGVSANAGSPSDRGGSEFILARHIGARIVDVGEDTARAAKHVVGELNAVIKRDVVLNLAAVTDFHARPDHHVLTDRAVFPDDGAWKDVAEMPDLCALPNDCTFVHVTRSVNQSAGKARILAHLGHARRSFLANG